jgi:cytochrome c551/c552
MKIRFFLVAVLSTTLVFATPPSEDGKAIFTTRCAGCHNVNKILTGPALAGVDQRRSIDWIVNFVQSSQTVIKNGDKDAVALFEKFNKIPMPDHKDLSADNIKSIVEYIKAEAKGTSDTKQIPVPETSRPLTTNDYLLYSMLGGSVVLLLLSLMFWVKVLKMRTQRIAAK